MSTPYREIPYPGTEDDLFIIRNVNLKHLQLAIKIAAIRKQTYEKTFSAILKWRAKKLYTVGKMQCSIAICEYVMHARMYSVHKFRRRLDRITGFDNFLTRSFYPSSKIKVAIGDSKSSNFCCNKAVILNYIFLRI